MNKWKMDSSAYGHIWGEKTTSPPPRQEQQGSDDKTYDNPKPIPKPRVKTINSNKENDYGIAREAGAKSNDVTENDYGIVREAGANSNEPDIFTLPPRQELQGSFAVVTKEQIRSTLPRRDDLFNMMKTMNAKSNNGPEKNVKEDVQEYNKAVDFNVFLLETQNDKVRGVLELSTLHHNVVDKVRTRIVCLFDVSGSMLLKCGKKKIDSKLTSLKKMVVDLIDALEHNEDYLGLVTFAEEAKTIIPLSLITESNRASIKKTIETMDQKYSSRTDLCTGLITAIDMLKQEDEATKYIYRNAIIVFSDGEINSGITDVDALLHATRERIRQCKPQLALKSDQWLSISCVTTGGNVSEAMYLLSKFCGNDAYYYIDSNTVNPQTDMMIPVLLRKSAIAQFLTMTVLTENGAELDPNNCTWEHSIRRKHRPISRATESVKISYYLHDMPAGSQKHFAVEVDLKNYRIHESPDLLNVELEFVDNKGNIQTTTKRVKFNDILTQTSSPTEYEKGVILLAKNDIRFSMQASCRKTANIISEKDGSSPEAVLEDGILDIKKLTESYADRARQPETKQTIHIYGREVVKNMSKLLETITKSSRGDGHKWTKIKAVSSSISRETPNVSNLVTGAGNLCPLPAVSDCATNRMRALALKIFQDQRADAEMYKKYGDKLKGAASDIVQSMGQIIDVLNASGTLQRNSTKNATTEQANTDDEEYDFIKLAKGIASS
ncbi:uncharacterized protein LOC126830151 isoform X2 [Patella vulgata]|uniref:uncharacterized protein LOC126830151 isoform X2 n=1 Tax=Patella vulgata TaxID=6465 RepID=UPI0024A81BAD|nr:uncharacterized protein LOC126830151 isoform X2 [Patella vulgata]